MKRLVIILFSFIIAVSSFGWQKSALASDPNPTNANPAWTGEYFNNAYFIGAPTVNRTDNVIAFNWGNAAPANGMPADNFAIRWGSDPYFTAGTYRFTVLADDGIAVTIDFQRNIINTLEATRPGQTITADVTLTEGRHHIQVDYREYGGAAYVYVSWTNLAANPNGPSLPGQTPALPAGQAAAYVNTNTLNVRSGPGLSFTVNTRASRNSVVNLIGRNADGTWVQVRLSNGVQGWVSSAYIVANVAISTLPVTSTTQTPPPTNAIATNSIQALNVRFGPGYGYGIMNVIGYGYQSSVIGRNVDGSWLNVQLADGSRGWVDTSYVILNVSITQIPVVAGGTTPPPTTRRHTVQSGETLFRISLRYNVNLQTLAAVNGIGSNYLIYAGQVLIIP